MKLTKKVAKGTNLAWANADHPDAKEGAGFYEVLSDNEHEVKKAENGGREINFTNTKVKFGKKLEWRKSTPDPEGEPANAENNEGHFVYADSVSDED